MSEAVIRDATDSGGASVTIPDETTNELTANVMVRDGQTIVLGGLFRERTQYTRRQVPWIADLPFIGAPFRGREDLTDRAEIIFMITPTIVNDQIVSEHAERAKSLIDSAVAGTREGLLPFSRDKQASRLLVEAQQYAAEGKTKKALYCVRRSLSLNPNQAQARLLLERLTTKTRTWPSQSVLETTFNTEMDLYLDEHGQMFEPTSVDSGEDVTLMSGEDTSITTMDGVVNEIGSFDSASDSATDITSGDEIAEGTDESFTSEDTTLESGESIEIAQAEDGENTFEGEFETEIETEIEPEAEPVDPAIAQAEADAASEATFDEDELASARESDAPSSESAFEDSDWIASLAEAEIGAAAENAPELIEETTEISTDEVATEADASEAEFTEPEVPAIVFDSEARTFDLNIEDAPLPTLLRDLSSQARRSIIVSPEVAGSVSASLFGLSLEETLEAILPANGYGFVEDGKVIRVLSLDTIAQQQAEAEALALAEAEAQAQAEAEALAQQAAELAAEAGDATDAAETASDPFATFAEQSGESTPEVSSTETGTVVDGPISLDSSESPIAETFGSTESDGLFETEAEFEGDLELAIDFDEPSAIEDQIDDTLSDVLLSSLSFTSFEWKPTVTRDGYTEPTSWVGDSSSEFAPEFVEPTEATEAAVAPESAEVDDSFESDSFDDSDLEAGTKVEPAETPSRIPLD